MEEKQVMHFLECLKDLEEGRKINYLFIEESGSNSNSSYEE
jgi:hypothetical protein